MNQFNCLKDMRSLKGIVLFFLLGGAAAVVAQDKLEGLRTTKQIVTVDKASSPYYAVQILALKLPPSDVNFFKQFDVVKEFPCADGYVRYTVGGFSSAAEGQAYLEVVKSKGYGDAVIVNTRRFGMGTGAYAPKVLVIDPSQTYLIQLSAFRFPVYLSFFEKFDTIYEFRMKDQIYRYTTPPVLGSAVQAELDRIRQAGYPDAFIVEMDVYMPFKIE